MHSIQLSRKKGFKLPPNTIVVARPTRYGNPFVVGKAYIRCVPVGWGLQWDVVRDNAHAVRLFRAWLDDMDPVDLDRLLAPLRGKNLACWCRVYECDQCGKTWEDDTTLTADGHSCSCIISTPTEYRRCTGTVRRVPCHGDVWIEKANKT